MENAPILVVDADPALRLGLARDLRQSGARVTDVASVADAEAALDRDEFDLIISDVHMPGNEGLQWTERLLQSPATPPVLLMTNQPEIATAMRAANLPVAGYLAKPLAFPALTALIHRVLAHQHRRRELRALAGEVRTLATTTAALPAGTADRLEVLALALEAEAGYHTRQTARSDEMWRRTVAETILVLEKTRDSFRSKELGRLRLHLRKVLTNGAMAWATLAGFLGDATPFDLTGLALF